MSRKAFACSRKSLAAGVLTVDRLTSTPDVWATINGNYAYHGEVESPAVQVS
ncbi:hypothetical protein ABH940_005325 [Streptacidiphilus sp. BW17]